MPEFVPTLDIDTAALRAAVETALYVDETDSDNETDADELAANVAVYAAELCDAARHYLVTCEWCEIDDSEDSHGFAETGETDRDRATTWHATVYAHAAHSVVDLVREVCATDAGRDELTRYVDAYGWDGVGHDLLLTRNRHGAGFWDRGPHTNAFPLLDAVAKRAGEVYADVDVDGSVNIN